jgi:hypothetical protein
MKGRPFTSELHLGHDIRSAVSVGDDVKLQLARADGTLRTIDANHLVAATGYRADCTKLSFLNQKLLTHLKMYDKAPVLNRNFESSCKGLYFLGPIAAMSFGPVMRFVFGATYSVRKILKDLSRDKLARGNKRSLSNTDALSVQV